MVKHIASKALEYTKSTKQNQITEKIIQRIIDLELYCEICDRNFKYTDIYLGGKCKSCGKIGCSRKECFGFNRETELCLKCRREKKISFVCDICGREIIKGCDNMISVNDSNNYHLSCAIEILFQKDAIIEHIIYSKEFKTKYKNIYENWGGHNYSKLIASCLLKHGESFLKYIINIFRQFGEKDNDKTILDIILTLFPKDIQAKRLLANILYRENNYKEAEDLFMQIISENPKDIEALLGLGIINFNSEKYEKALSYCKRISEFNDNKKNQNQQIIESCEKLEERVKSIIKNLKEKKVADLRKRMKCRYCGKTYVKSTFERYYKGHQEKCKKVNPTHSWSDEDWIDLEGTTINEIVLNKTKIQNAIFEDKKIKEVLTELDMYFLKSKKGNFSLRVNSIPSTKSS
ncbi:MAG: tetratricopeptide repeat protein [Candidatus Lokiarchaeota archaeon]|nr:tetratricopeptide repeat protein [Candidatus Lokiarchaeota archaeon]